MSLELKKRSLQIERVAGEGSGETVAEGTVRIPERYPPISRALQLTAHPIVNNVEATDDRVLVEGSVRLELTYASVETTSEADEGSDGRDEYQIEHLQRVEWDRELSFAYLLEVVGATEESDVDVEARVSSVNYDVRSDDATVDVDVVLHLSGRVVVLDQVELTTGVTGEDVESDYEEILVRSRVGEVKASSRISASLSLGGRSIPEDIIDVKLVPSTVEVEHAADEVVIRGYFDCSSLYVGSEGAGAQFVEWPKGALFALHAPYEGASHQAIWEPKIELSAIDFYVEQNEDGASIRVEAQVAATATAYRSEIVTCLVGVSSPEAEVASRIERTAVYESVGEGVTRPDLSGVLELAGDDPPIERLLRGTVDVVVQEIHVLGDKVAIEGQVEAELLYVGRGETDSQLHTARWPYATTLDTEVPLPGAEPGLDRNVSVSVRGVEFDLINRETVEVRVQATVQAMVGRLREVEMVVEAVRVPPEHEDQPTFTFVVTNEEDTLWKLAQLYRTSVEEILNHNDWIVEDEPLAKGRKVCIVH